MKITERLSELIADACLRRKRIIVILKNSNGLYEGIVDRVYEKRIVKFITSRPGCQKITGFLLVSDIRDVIC